MVSHWKRWREKVGVTRGKPCVTHCTATETLLSALPVRRQRKVGPIDQDLSYSRWPHELDSRPSSTMQTIATEDCIRGVGKYVSPTPHTNPPSAA